MATEERLVACEALVEQFLGQFLDASAFNSDHFDLEAATKEALAHPRWRAALAAASQQDAQGPEAEGANPQGALAGCLLEPLPSRARVDALAAQVQAGEVEAAWGAGLATLSAVDLLYSEHWRAFAAALCALIASAGTSNEHRDAAGAKLREMFAQASPRQSAAIYLDVVCKGSESPGSHALFELLVHMLYNVGELLGPQGPDIFDEVALSTMRTIVQAEEPGAQWSGAGAGPWGALVRADAKRLGGWLSQWFLETRSPPQLCFHLRSSGLAAFVVQAAGHLHDTVRRMMQTQRQPALDLQHCASVVSMVAALVASPHARKLVLPFGDVGPGLSLAGGSFAVLSPPPRSTLEPVPGSNDLWRAPLDAQPDCDGPWASGRLTALLLDVALGRLPRRTTAIAERAETLMRSRAVAALGALCQTPAGPAWHPLAQLPAALSPVIVSPEARACEARAVALRLYARLVENLELRLLPAALPPLLRDACCLSPVAAGPLLRAMLARPALAVEAATLAVETPALREASEPALFESVLAARVAGPPPPAAGFRLWATGSLLAFRVALLLGWPGPDAAAPLLWSVLLVDGSAWPAPFLLSLAMHGHVKEGEGEPLAELEQVRGDAEMEDLFVDLRETLRRHPAEQSREPYPGPEEGADAAAAATILAAPFPATCRDLVAWSTRVVGADDPAYGGDGGFLHRLATCVTPDADEQQRLLRATRRTLAARGAAVSVAEQSAIAEQCLDALRPTLAGLLRATDTPAGALVCALGSSLTPSTAAFALGLVASRSGAAQTALVLAEQVLLGAWQSRAGLDAAWQPLRELCTTAERVEATAAQRRAIVARLDTLGW